MTANETGDTDDTPNSRRDIAAGLFFSCAGVAALLSNIGPMALAWTLLFGGALVATVGAWAFRFSRRLRLEHVPRPHRRVPSARDEDRRRLQRTHGRPD